MHRWATPPEEPMSTIMHAALRLEPPMAAASSDSSLPRLAVATVVARGPRPLEHEALIDDAFGFQLCNLRGMLSSLRAVGWKHEIVCLVAGASDKELGTIRHLCDRIARPAPLRFRVGPGKLSLPNGNATVQRRSDALATIMKLHAWRLVQFDLVLAVDSDVLFLESPLAFLTDVRAAGALFRADAERAARGYYGINSHMMSLKPSLDLFAVLATNAATGHYMSYTQSDQDVIESIFPPRVVTPIFADNLGRSEVSRRRQKSMPARTVDHLHYFHHGCLISRGRRVLSTVRRSVAGRVRGVRVAGGVRAWQRMSATERERRRLTVEYQYLLEWLVANRSRHPEPMASDADAEALDAAWVRAADLHPAEEELVDRCWKRGAWDGARLSQCERWVEIGGGGGL